MFFLTSSDVRFYNPIGNEQNEGLIEVRVDGIWGPICGRDHDDLIARTICRQLGFSDFDIYYFSEAEKEFSAYNLYNETFYIGLSCSEGSTSLRNCTYEQLRGTKEQCSSGSSNGYAGLKCREKGTNK